MGHENHLLGRGSFIKLLNDISCFNCARMDQPGLILKKGEIKLNHGSYKITDRNKLCAILTCNL